MEESRQNLKKVLSGLFSVIFIIAICVVIYLNQQFVKKQINNVRGVYYVSQGDTAYRKNNMNKAIKFYNIGLKYYPEHYGAWCNLGNIYVAYEDYYSALHAYSQSFKHNPKMVFARMNYGLIASEKLGYFNLALDQYNKVINIQRKMISIPYIYNNRISSKLNRAIAYYNIGVTYRLKSLYEANDDWELQRKYLSKAIQAYKKSLEIAPDRYDTLYNLGIAYHLAGRYFEAGECYCKAIHQKPMNFEAHYNLAVLHRRMRHYKESYEEIDKASTLVTALGSNSAEQQYVAIMMNDIMRTMYEDQAYKNELKRVMSVQQSNNIETKKGKKSKKDRETKKDKQKGTVTSEKINLVNGKVVASEELDKAVLESFGQCAGMAYFEEIEEE